MRFAVRRTASLALTAVDGGFRKLSLSAVVMMIAYCDCVVNVPFGSRATADDDEVNGAQWFCSFHAQREGVPLLPVAVLDRWADRLR